MTRKAIPLLIPLLLSCSDSKGVEELGVGMRMSVDFLGDTDVVAFHFLIDRVGCDAMETFDPFQYEAIADLQSQVAPGDLELLELLDAGAGHVFASVFVPADAGCYKVVATPVSAYVDVDNFTVSSDCAIAQADSVVVTEGLTTEVDTPLISQCVAESQGGLDIPAALDHTPTLTLELDDAYGFQCEVMEVCATFSDVDNDPVDLVWSHPSAGLRGWFPGNSDTHNVVDGMPAPWVDPNDPMNDISAYSQGVHGAAFDLNGVGYIELGDLGLGDTGTVDLWVKPDTWNSPDWFRILSNIDGPSDKDSFGITVDQSGHVHVGPGGSLGSAVSTTPLSTTEFTRVTAVVEGDKASLYINGVLEDSRTFTESFGFHTLGLGAKFILYWGSYFDGAIDGLKIYDHALRPAEIVDQTGGLITYRQCGGFVAEDLGDHDYSVTAYDLLDDGTRLEDILAAPDESNVTMGFPLHVAVGSEPLCIDDDSGDPMPVDPSVNVERAYGCSYTPPEAFYCDSGNAATYNFHLPSTCPGGTFDPAAVYPACGPRALWELTIDGASSGADEGHGVAVHGASGDIVAGGFVTNADRDIWLSRRDAEGNELWTEVIDDGVGNDLVYGVATDPDGNVYATGSVTTATAGADVWTRKYDADPAMAMPSWTETWNWIGTVDLGYGVEVADDGTVNVGGYGKGPSFTDLLILRYANSGGLQSVFTKNVSAHDGLYDIVLNEAGNAIAGGFIGNSSQTWLGEISPTTGIVWSRTHPGGASGHDWIIGVTVDGGGNVYAVGKMPRSGTGMDGFVRKVEPDGSAIVWESFIAGSGIDEAQDVVVWKDSAVHVVGLTDTGTGQDGFVTALDPEDGSELWTWTRDGAGAGADSINDIAVSPDQKLVVVGTETNAAGNTDIWIAKVRP